MDEITTSREMIHAFVDQVLAHSGCSEGKKAALGAVFDPNWVDPDGGLDEARDELRGNLEYLREYGDVADITSEGIDRLMVKLGEAPKVTTPDVTMTVPGDLFEQLTKVIGGMPNTGWDGGVMRFYDLMKISFIAHRSTDEWMKLQDRMITERTRERNQ